MSVQTGQLRKSFIARRARIRTFASVRTIVLFERRRFGERFTADEAEIRSFGSVTLLVHLEIAHRRKRLLALPADVRSVYAVHSLRVRVHLRIRQKGLTAVRAWEHPFPRVRLMVQFQAGGFGELLVAHRADMLAFAALSLVLIFVHFQSYHFGKSPSALSARVRFLVAVTFFMTRQRGGRVKRLSTFRAHVRTFIAVHLPNVLVHARRQRKSLVAV